jgi:hypothetical protein
MAADTFLELFLVNKLVPGYSFFKLCGVIYILNNYEFIYKQVSDLSV